MKFKHKILFVILIFLCYSTTVMAADVVRQTYQPSSYRQIFLTGGSGTYGTIPTNILDDIETTVFGTLTSATNFTIELNFTINKYGTLLNDTVLYVVYNDNTQAGGGYGPATWYNYYANTSTYNNTIQWILFSTESWTGDGAEMYTKKQYNLSVLNYCIPTNQTEIMIRSTLKSAGTQGVHYGWGMMAINYSINNNTIIIARTSQTPSDINTSNVIGNPVKISYNVTGDSLISSSIQLFYKTNSTKSNIMYYLNGTGFSGYFDDNTSLTPRVNSGSNYTWTLLDNEILPGTYNFGPVAFDRLVHANVPLSNSNQYVKTEYYNVSPSAQYGIFEIMANSSLGASPASAYYCNSSYTTGSITGSTNCALIGTITATIAYNHCHANYSCHNIFPFTVNTITKRIGNVGVTNISYFLFGGNNNWNVFNVPNLTRIGMTQTTTNTGGSWTSRTYSIDQHVHQFDITDDYSLYYYACANSSTGESACSSVSNDLFQVGGLPPSSPQVYSPINTTYNKIIHINYTASESPNGYAIVRYNISLLNSTYGFLSTIISSNGVNLNYSWNNTGTSDGIYIIRVEAYDSLLQTSIGYSEEFTINNTIASPILTIVGPADNNITKHSLSALFSYSDSMGGAVCGLNVDGTTVATTTLTGSTGSITSFSDSTTTGNFTIVNTTGIFTKSINIPTDVTITSATLKIKGYNITVPNSNLNVNPTNVELIKISGGSTGGTVANLMDTDNITAYAGAAATPILNFTWDANFSNNNNDYNQANIYIILNDNSESGYPNANTKIYCADNSSLNTTVRFIKIGELTRTNPSPMEAFTPWSINLTNYPECFATTYSQVWLRVTQTTTQGVFNGASRILINYTTGSVNYPKNVTLNLNGTQQDWQIFNYGGTNNSNYDRSDTINFTSIFSGNPSGYPTNITFRSNNNGVLEYSDLVINYVTPYTTLNYTPPVSGNYSWNISCYSSISLVTTSSVLRSFVYDTALPIIGALSTNVTGTTPIAGDHISLLSTIFDNFLLQNCSLYTNQTGTYSVVTTFNPAGIYTPYDINYSYIAPSETSIGWYIACTDTAGNTGTSSPNVFTIKDFALPTITLGPRNDFLSDNSTVISAKLYNLSLSVKYQDNGLRSSYTAINCNVSGNIYSFAQGDYNDTIGWVNSTVNLFNLPIQTCIVTLSASDITAIYAESYKFYIGGYANISNINLYDNSTLDLYRINYTTTSEGGSNGHAIIATGKTYRIENLTGGNYNFVFYSTTTLPIYNTVNVGAAKTSLYYNTSEAVFIAYTYNTFNFAPLLSNFYLNRTTVNTAYVQNNTAKAIYYMNASLMRLIITSTTFTVTDNFTLSVQQNLSKDYLLGAPLTVFLKDEQTNGVFNLAGTNSTKLLVKCVNVTEYYNITTTTYTLPISCNFTSLQFDVNYGTASYYRTFITLNQSSTIYLADMLTTSVVNNNFYIQDLFNKYINKKVIVKELIGTNLVEITGGELDIEGKFKTYLIENNNYQVWIYSDNQPPLMQGSYIADTVVNKYITLGSFSPEMSAGSPSFNNNVHYYIYLNNDTANNTWINILYNDTSSLTTSIVWTITNESDGTLYDTITIVNASYFFTSYNITPLINGSLSSNLLFAYAGKNYNDKRTFGLREFSQEIFTFVTRTWMNWALFILITILAIMSTVKTGNIINLFICGVAAFFVFAMKWFELGIGVLIFVTIITIIGFLKSREKEGYYT